jgi:hypothetical protein
MAQPPLETPTTVLQVKGRGGGRTGINRFDNTHSNWPGPPCKAAHTNVLPGPACRAMECMQGFARPSLPCNRAQANVSPSPVRHAFVLILIPIGSMEGGGGTGRRSQLGEVIFPLHYMPPQSIFQLGKVITAYQFCDMNHK